MTSKHRFFSDMEWLLRSGQANSAELIAGLLKEHYPEVFLLSLGLLRDPEQARQAARLTFVEALLNVHQYRSASELRTWLYKLALDAIRQTRISAAPASNDKYQEPVPQSEAENRLWQAVDGLEDKLRLPILLHYLVGWPVSEIGRLLGEKDIQVETDLSTSRQILLEAVAEPGLGETELKGILGPSLLARWPWIKLETAEVQALAQAVETEAAQSRGNKRRLSAVIEVVLVAAALLVTIGLVWSANSLTPDPDKRGTPSIIGAAEAALVVKKPVIYYARPGDTVESIAANVGMSVETLSRLNALAANAQLQPGQELKITVEAKSEQTPTPVRHPVKPDPLSVGSPAEDILARLKGGELLWYTLWVDFQYISYGPPSYVGPARTYRYQAWVSQPDQSLEIFGISSNKPLWSYIVTGGHGYYSIPDSGQSFLDGTYTDTQNELLISPQARELIFPGHSNWLSAGGTIQVIKSENVAGRSAIKMDWINQEGYRQATIWVDARSGVILRERQYGGDNFATVLSDLVVTAVAFDINFPAGLFDPQSSGQAAYLKDYLGSAPDTLPQPTPEWALPPDNREPLPLTRPLPGFDPSTSRLTFQYSRTAATAIAQGITGTVPIEIFGDGYLLGRTRFGLPWSLLCTRSPDGQRIAFANWSGSSSDTDATLNWFNLANLTNVYQPFGQVPITQFSFSPDSHRLAAFISAGPRAGLEVLEIGTGEKTRLLDLNQAHSLVWSPDGRNLAFIGGISGEPEDLIVIDVALDRVTYRKPYLKNSRVPFSSSPVVSWGVPFPVEMGGMEACALPPPR